MGSNLKGTLILIVDDNDINRMVFSKMIEVSFPEITTIEAANGQAAFTTCLDRKPALILMDLHMPVLNGYEATRRIKAVEGFKEIPIIATTGSFSDEEIKHGYDVGITDFLIKPVAPDQLDLMLKKYLQVNGEVFRKEEVLTENGQHIAYNVLLESLGNDDEVTQEVLKQTNVFLEEALTDLKACFFNKDVTALKLLIHQMRGVAVNARFIALSGILKHYEEISTIDGFRRTDFLNEVEKEIDTIKKQLILYIR
ncbi:MAG TPA: response regulator [Pseudosphingobacterium sp.]|nr:response regulator [Pseudosphingobacterium sp.]